MSNNPDVSVITALFNGARFIRETAESVLQQSGVQLEWIVIDDGSQDNGLKIVRQYTDNVSTGITTIQLVRHEQNQGIKPAYLDGVKRSSGKYFKILDHDDVLGSEDALAKQVRLMEKHPDVGLVFSRTHLIDSRGKPFKDKSYPFVDGQFPLDKRILTANVLFNWRLPFIHGSFLTRRSAFDELYRESQVHFDTELLVDMLKSRYGIGYIDEPLFRYRIHEGNYSRTTEQALGEFYSGRRYIAEQLGLDRISQEASVICWRTMGVLGDLKTRVVSSKERK